MAKAKVSKAAIKKFEENYTEIIKEAVAYATDKAKGDVYTKALVCLAEYYASYDPTSYNPRTHSLENAFVPYQHITKDDKYIISTVGVEYNSSLLDGYYQSGSEKYGAKKMKRATSLNMDSQRVVGL